MKLINEEKTLLESNNGQLVLTTHRVRFDGKSTTGETKIVSILLDELCSCELTVKSYPILILLAALSLLYAFVGINSTLAGIVGAVIFGVAFWFTRKQTLSLASAGAAINVESKNMKLVEVREFIDSVESTKFAIRI